MADQPVRVTNFPEAGNGTVASVAFDLASQIWTAERAKKGPAEDVRREFLDLYAECWRAAKGLRV